MIVGPAIPKPDFQDWTIRGNLADGPVQDVTLRSKPTDKTVETTHRVSALRLGRELAQIGRGALQALRQYAHDLDGDLWEISDQSEEQVLLYP